MRLQAMGSSLGIYEPAVIPGCAPSDYKAQMIGPFSYLVPVYEDGCGGNDSANAGGGTNATAAQESSNVNLNQIQFNPSINVGSILTSANVNQDVAPSVNVSAGAQSGASSQASSSAPGREGFQSSQPRGFQSSQPRRVSTGGGSMPLNPRTRISATPQPQPRPQPQPQPQPQPRTGETHITVVAPSSPGATPGPEPSQALPPSTPQNEDDIYLGPAENAEVQAFQDQLAGVEGVRDQSGAVILALLGVTALGIWYFKKQA